MPPTGTHDPARDPLVVNWLVAVPGLRLEAWISKLADARLSEFDSVRADYAQRRLDVQVSVAEAQLRLAKEAGLPLIIQLPPGDEVERRMMELLMSVLGEGSDHGVMLYACRGRPACAPASLMHLQARSALSVGC